VPHNPASYLSVGVAVDPVHDRIAVSIASSIHHRSRLVGSALSPDHGDVAPRAVIARRDTVIVLPCSFAIRDPPTAVYLSAAINNVSYTLRLENTAGRLPHDCALAFAPWISGILGFNRCLVHPHDGTAAPAVIKADKHPSCANPPVSQSNPNQAKSINRRVRNGLIHDVLGAELIAGGGRNHGQKTLL